MPVSRPTFLVQVRPEEQVVVVENVRTGQRVHVRRVVQIGREISRWLAESREDGTQEPGRRRADEPTHLL
jgi:hypothetical protein